MSDLLYGLTSGDFVTEVNLKSVLIVLASATIIGLIISLVYLFTHKKEGYSQAFCVALILLAPIVGLVILFIENNIATAFSLAGAFALVRFRSAPGDVKDIAFVFMSVTMGLACGLGHWFYAGVAAVILCAIIVAIHFSNYAKKKGNIYELKITVPETLNYVGAFDDVLKKYTNSFRLVRVKSVDFGALFEISFSVALKDDNLMREMMDDVRALNGNLKVMLSTEATSTKNWHFQ